MSLAPSTQAACGKNIQAFCRQQGFPTGWSVPAETVLVYCVYMCGLGFGSQYHGNSLDTIAITSKSAGFPNPCRDFRIRKALEGWAGNVARERDARLPVSPC